MRFVNRTVRWWLLSTVTLLVIMTSGMSAQEITYWSHRIQDVEGFTKSVIVPFEKANPGVKVTLASMSAKDLRSKILTASISGVGPDIFDEGVRRTTFYMANDMALPLDKYLNGSAFASDVLGMDLFSYGGVTYAVPFIAAPGPVLYRADYFESGGLDSSKAPTSWNDLLEVARKLTRIEGDRVTRFGVDPRRPGNHELTGFLEQNGVYMLSEDLMRSTINAPGGAETLRFILELLDAVNPSHINSPISSFVEGSMALTYRNTPFLVKQAGVPWIDEVKVALPIYKGGDKTKRVANFNGMNALFLNRHSKNPDLAWRFVEHMYRLENLEYLHGAEGFAMPSKSLLTSAKLDRFDRITVETVAHLITWKRAFSTPEYGKVNGFLHEQIGAVYDRKLAPEIALDAIAEYWTANIDDRSWLK